MERNKKKHSMEERSIKQTNSLHIYTWASVYKCFMLLIFPLFLRRRGEGPSTGVDAGQRAEQEVGFERSDSHGDSFTLK